MVTREPKITFGEMRAMGVRGLTAFNRKASYNGSRPLLAATHLDQRSHVLDHVLGSRPEYLVAVARSDSVEGFLDVLFEVLHFDDVSNLDGFAGTDRGGVTPGIEEVEVRGVKVRYVAERFRDTLALGLHGDLCFRHGTLRGQPPRIFSPICFDCQRSVVPNGYR